MAVEITYFWPSFLLDAVGLYDMYTNRAGDELYSHDSDKILNFQAKTNKVRSTAQQCNGGVGRPQSTYRIALPFQVQDRFVDIVTAKGTHAGVDIVKHLDDETGSEVSTLNLEMASLDNDAEKEARIQVRLDRHLTQKTVQDFLDKHEKTNGSSFGWT
jgi:hypothetical protein